MNKTAGSQRRRKAIQNENAWYSGMRTLSFIVLLLTSVSGLAALKPNDEGLPGILQYVRENSGKNNASEKAAPTSSTPFQQRKAATPREAGNWSGGDLRRRLVQQDQELKQLRQATDRHREEAEELKAQIAVLKQELAMDTSDARDGKAAEQLSEMELRAEKAEKEVKMMTVSLSLAQADAKVYMNAALGLKSQLSDLSKRLAASEDAARAADSLKQQAEASEKQVTSLQASVAELQARLASMPDVKLEELNDAAGLEDYATGAMMGSDIQKMQEMQHLLGLKMDNRLLLAGMRDALNRKVLLNSETLEKTLADGEARIQKARQKIAVEQRKAGEAWLKKYLRENKGIRQDKSGFWYRLDYTGDGAPIGGGETLVEVVVTEKLTDGTVVEDMDSGGRTLSMALDDYPPLFRDALKLMKDHGAMTLIVPPELAYGDEGYPPKVPPGATMVYTLRVENVKPALDIALPEVPR